MSASYCEEVTRAPAPCGVPQRSARAVVVAATVTPAVLLAHLLTRGATPGPLGLAAVVLLVGLVAFAAPLTGAVRLAAAVVVAQVAGHAALAALTPGGTGAGCLPAVGRGAEAGLHLALLRADAACSDGTLAAGPAATALLGAAVTAAALVAGQVLLAALTAALVTAGETAAHRAAGLVRAVLPALPAPFPASVVATLRRTLAADRFRPVPAPVPAAPLTRRGPPVVACP
jgi:hypothetical protein